VCTFFDHHMQVATEMQHRLAKSTFLFSQCREYSSVACQFNKAEWMLWVSINTVTTHCTLCVGWILSEVYLQSKYVLQDIPVHYTRKAGFVIYQQKGWLGASKDTWVNGSPTIAAKVILELNCLYTTGKTQQACEDRLLLLWGRWQSSAKAWVCTCC